MSVSYIGQGAAQLFTTTSVVPYPSVLAAGDAIVLFASNDAAITFPSPGSFTELDSASSGGGLNSRAWVMTSTGSESGSVTLNASGGTKGVALMINYRATSGVLSIAAATSPTDTDTSSTAFSLTSGTSPISVAGDRIVAMVTALAPTGTYSSSASSPTVGQSGGSVTSTSRAAARASSNTLYYGYADGLVNTGATGALTYSATTNGANGAGVGKLILLREVSSVSYSDTAPAATAAVTATPPTSFQGGALRAVTVAAAATALALGPGLVNVTLIIGGDSVPVTVSAMTPAALAGATSTLGSAPGGTASGLDPAVSTQLLVALTVPAASTAVTALVPAAGGGITNATTAPSATAAAQLPTVVTSGTSTVTAVVATGAATALVPSVTTSDGVVLAVPAANAQVQALTPAVLSALVVNLTVGVPPGVTFTAQGPLVVVQLSSIATVEDTPGVVVAAENPIVLSGGDSVLVIEDPATATAGALAPAVVTGTEAPPVLDELLSKDREPRIIRITRGGVRPKIMYHDPDERLDYVWPWGLVDPTGWSWLDDDDVITAASATCDEVAVTVDDVATNGRTVVSWITGGTPGTNVELTCTVEAASGRIGQRTVMLAIRQR